MIEITNFVACKKYSKLNMKYFLNILWRNKFLIITFLLYSILAFELNARISNAIGNGILILLILMFLSKLKKYNIITKMFSYILVTILSVFIATDLCYFYEYKTLIPLAVIASIAETTFRESQSMMKVYWLPSLVFFSITLTINCFLVNKLEKNKLNGWVALLLILPLYLVFISLSYFRFDNDVKSDLKKEFKRQPILSSQFYFGDMFPLVTSDVILLIVYNQEMRRLKNYANSPKKLPIGLQLDMNKIKPTKIYVVLGESSNRDHYSLYGYNKPTTPFLDKLYQQPDSILSFYKAISPACVTRDAIRLVLTFATPRDIDPFFENKTILNLANDAGYETIWLSNQDKIGIFDSYVGCIAAQANKSEFLVSSKKYPLVDDLNLVRLLPEFISYKKKQFIVLHLQGSHMKYEERFGQEDISIEDDNQTVQSYDRSIHHSDLMLSKLYELVKNQGEDALIYYISDHGENIKAENQEYGHGTLKGTDQYRIPLLIINHNSGVQVSKIVNRYILKDSGLINSLSTVDILAEIMGYNVSDSIVKKTIQESKYVYHVDQLPRLFDNVEPY